MLYKCKSRYPNTNILHYTYILQMDIFQVNDILKYTYKVLILLYYTYTHIKVPSFSELMFYT